MAESSAIGEKLDPCREEGIALHTPPIDATVASSTDINTIDNVDYIFFEIIIVDPTVGKANPNNVPTLSGLGFLDEHFSGEDREFKTEVELASNLSVATGETNQDEDS